MTENLPLVINENLQKMSPLDISKTKGKLIQQLLQIKANELKGTPNDFEIGEISMEDPQKALERIYKSIRIYRVRIEQLKEIDEKSNLKKDALVFLDTIEEHFRQNNPIKDYKSQKPVFPDLYSRSKKNSDHNKKLLFNLRKKLVGYHQLFDVCILQNLLDKTKYLPF
ncbi:hypothetical protein [Aquimarina sp. I32.4]|uniref:hypothetical protein n=1 Tax=Aquimarina sp. I32.4 TaxID=2053903 RepID=UPI0011AFB0BA|nr:hypothetical protein [Aquimarina sp. I32.4]